MRNGIICAAATAAAAAEIISGNKLHQLLYIASRYIEILLALESTEKNKNKSLKLLYSPNEKPVSFRSALFELLEGDSHLPPNVCSTKILDYTF